MSNELVPITFTELNSLAQAVAASKLFGIKTPQEALSLMAIAQAEGLHPAIAARDYHIIQGRPTLKADAMMSRFQAAGGKVEWHTYSDECCDATLTHPQGGTVRVMWDMARVKKAQISNNAMYTKYPRNMLRARCISEGVRTVYPGVSVGMITPEEIGDIEIKTAQPPIQVQTLDAQFTEIQQPEPLQMGEKDLKTLAKEFAEALEIVPSLELLEKLVKDNAITTQKLSVELPAWHMKLVAKISDRRAYLSQPKDALDEALDIPDFLQRKVQEAAE